MSGVRKRAVRQRVWSSETDDKASARGVGENLRNLDSVLTDQPAVHVKTWTNRVYSDDGLSFESSSRPQGALVIFVERADGSWQSCDAVPDLKFRGVGTVVAKIGGLTPGQRYATIRMLVVG